MRFLLIAFLITNCLQAYANLTIASYNIRNFDYDERYRIHTNKNHLFRTIHKMSPDFMAVQEINDTHTFKSFIQKNFKNRYGVALSKCGGAHGQKLGFVYDKRKFKLISFKENLEVSNPNQQHRGSCHSGSRPLAIGHFKLIEQNKEVIAISLHLKSGGRPKSIAKRFKQLEILNKVVSNYRKSGLNNFVVMGDFNSTEYIFKGRHYQRFQYVVSKMGLIDLAKDIKCTSYWWGGIRDGKQHPSILDHILISQNLIERKNFAQATATTHCEKLSCKAGFDNQLGISFDEVSDHCPLVSNI